MSTFESSSSFAAPAAASNNSTLVVPGLRKTLNHRALTIETRTPTFRAKPFFDASEKAESDEEEERIYVNLLPAEEYYHEHQHDPAAAAAVNVTVQLGSFAALRNTCRKAWKTERPILTSALVFVLFFILVLLGGSVAKTTMSSASVFSHSGAHVIAPSGRSMRFAPHDVPTIPIWAPRDAAAVVEEASPADVPPSTVVRAARAAEATKRAVPAPPSDSTPAPPSEEKIADVVLPIADIPSGKVSAKFRLLYVVGSEEHQQRHHRRQDTENLGELFNGGRL